MRSVASGFRSGWRGFWRAREAMTAVEYGLIGAGIALAMVVALFALGDEIEGVMGDVQSAISSKRN
jgi:Flp pilus assembly pilin Flp